MISILNSDGPWKNKTKMTDSEAELNTDVFNFQNVNTTVSARGPNINISNLSFRNQLTSTMYMPRNFQQQRRAESVYNQRSMYYRRETSPMSIHSAFEMRPQNFQPYYPSMSSQRSMINGRSVSPSMSMRSIDSTTSLSAANIAFAFKNIKYNKHDLKVIKEAYRKLMKQGIWNRIERRRELRLFLKENADDSGEQGSDSSISSDDDRTIKTKENMSSCRSTNINLIDFQHNVKDNNLLQDCTENVKQISFRNKFPISSGSLRNLSNTSINQSQNNSMQKDRFKNSFLLPSQRFNKSIAESVISESLEKPCKNFQYLNMENVKNHHSQDKRAKNNANGKTDSEDDEIFSAASVRDNAIRKQKKLPKRSLDSEDENLPNNKRTKLSPPVKEVKKRKMPLKSRNYNSIENNKHKRENSFEFAIPTLPVKKGKPKVQEKLIAKSAPPIHLIQSCPERLPTTEDSAPTNIQEKVNVDQSQIYPESTDVSMRPSFIKRKLFTQKLDVTEKANLSSDSTYSPQNIYNAVVKEKNKTRKLVTSQSCLNREVQDDSNLLDLIHKIVPPDRMNATNQTSINQTAKRVFDNKSKKDDDRWDVTSVLSMVNDDDASDTFTDEEIFIQDKIKKTPKHKKEQDHSKNVRSIVTNNNNNENKSLNMSGSTFTDEEIFTFNATKRMNSKQKREVQKKIDPKGDKNREVKQLTTTKTVKCNAIHKNKLLSGAKSLCNTDSESDIECPAPWQKTISRVTAQSDIHKNKLRSGTKTFWETDFESDIECPGPPLKTIPRVTAQSGNTSVDKAIPVHELREPEVSLIPIELIKDTTKYLNKTLTNQSVDTVHKFNFGTISTRSHRTVRKKKCCVDDVTYNSKSIVQTANKSSKNTKPISLQKECPDITTNSKPNTRLNTSRNTSQSKQKLETTSRRDRSASNTKKKESNDKTNLKEGEKKETPKNKSKSETRTKKTQQKLEARNKSVTEPVMNQPVSNVHNCSRPNTRLNASKENLFKNIPSKRERSVTDTTKDDSPYNIRSLKKNMAKEPAKSNTKCDTTSKRPKNKNSGAIKRQNEL